MRDTSAGTWEWPADRPISGAGFERVDATVSCVLTRFRLRSAWWLPPFYFAFRRIRKEARQLGGLIRASFLIENLRTCYSLSLWTDDGAIVEFGTRVRSHVGAANRAFGRTYRRDLRRAEICSTQWRLWAVSHNLNWDDLDLRAVLAAQTGQPAEQIATGDRLWRRVGR